MSNVAYSCFNKMLAAAFLLGFLFAGVNSQGVVSYGINSDGTSSFSGKVPIGGTDNNKFSAFGSLSQPSGDITKGLSMDNMWVFSQSIEIHSTPEKNILFLYFLFPRLQLSLKT